MTGLPVGRQLATALSTHSARSALNYGGRTYSYLDLRSRVIDYQTWARRAGLAAADRVLFAGEPGLDFYACLIAGILGSYTVSVSSPELPPTTLARLAGCLRPAMLIGPTALQTAPGGWRALAPAEVNAGARAELTAAEPPHAYLSLTSGTLGMPVSALVDARALGEFVAWAAREFALTADDRWFEAADPGSDLALVNALLALASGACLTVPQGRQRLRAASLAASNGTTVMRIVPGTGRLMLAEASRRPVSLPGLRLLAFGGDELPAALPARLLRAVRADARTVNTYGLTEAAGFLLYHWFAACQLATDPGGAVPLGRPVPGVTARIEPSAGVAGPTAGAESGCGELIVESAAVALEISQVAGQGPVRRKPAGGAVAELRTGDLVFSSEHGITFHGRIGREVKFRGRRVNLAQLDRLVSNALGVAACVVQHEGTLIALVESAIPITPLDLAKSIGDTTSTLVVPQRVVAVPRLPRTRSGKVSVSDCTEIAAREIDKRQRGDAPSPISG